MTARRVPRLPVWARVSGLVALALVGVFAAAVLLGAFGGGGEHDPGGGAHPTGGGHPTGGTHTQMPDHTRGGHRR